MADPGDDDSLVCVMNSYGSEGGERERDGGNGGQESSKEGGDGEYCEQE